MKTQDIKLNLKGYNYYCRYHENNSSKHHPMVFLSGAFQNMDSWKNFTKTLKKEFPVILVDLPGSGKADFLPYHFGGDFLVEAIKKMLDKLNIIKANIIAASYGTPTAFNFAAKYPEMVSHLIMGGVMKEMPENRKNDVEKIYQLVQNGNLKSFAHETTGLLLNFEKGNCINKFSLVKRVMVASLARISESDTLKMVENTRRIIFHGALDLTKAPDVPTLIYTGEHDHFTKPEYCHEVAEHFKEATFTTIKNADHLFHIEQTQTVINMGTCFIKGEPLEKFTTLNKIEQISNIKPTRTLYATSKLAS